jgi:hypothetical protein
LLKDEIYEAEGPQEEEKDLLIQEDIKDQYP